MADVQTLPPPEPPVFDESPAPGPFLLEFFTVQGPGFRRTAYCDPAGAWRDAYTNEELFGAVAVME